MKTYRLVSNYGYGDKTWLERDLTEQDVINYFINNRNYPKDTTFEDCPDNNSDCTYYYEEDNPDDIEDWDWQDS
jgi:hypothetical protein